MFTTSSTSMLLTLPRTTTIQYLTAHTRLLQALQLAHSVSVTMALVSTSLRVYLHTTSTLMARLLFLMTRSLLQSLWRMAQSIRSHTKAASSSALTATSPTLPLLAKSSRLHIQLQSGSGVAHQATATSTLLWATTSLSTYTSPPSMLHRHTSSSSHTPGHLQHGSATTTSTTSSQHVRSRLRVQTWL